MCAVYYNELLIKCYIICMLHQYIVCIMFLLRCLRITITAINRLSTFGSLYIFLIYLYRFIYGGLITLLIFGGAFVYSIYTACSGLQVLI